jgi:DNA-binding CsgD family transcriptional regulator/tetratricopeptide (TPR) repeat protein
VTAGLCAELVGRSAEVEWLRGLTTDAAQGRGRTAALTGEAGVGKSRLAREATRAGREAGVAVAVGRCVEGPVAGTLRPLTEAVTGLLRTTATPDVPLLVPYRAVLGRLAPDLLGSSPDPAAGDPDPVHLGEGLLRLLTVHGRGRGALLVLEDLHDADPLTLAVVEYLADTLVAAAVEVSLLVTLRPEPSAGLDVVEALIRRRSVERTALSPLGPAEMEQLVRSCSPGLPDPAVRVVVERAGGVPFLAEELLAAATDRAGTVDPDRVVEVVPLSLLDAVRRRTTSLVHDGAHLLALAAVVGRSAPLELLGDVTGRPVAVVHAALQPAVHASLLEPGAACTFRHALTRDALLASMLPSERAELARRLLPAAGRCGLEPPVLAALAETAEDGTAATRAWLAAADDALREGLLEGADRALRRAERQARTAGDGDLQRTVALRRLRALALAGQADAVLVLADGLLASTRLDHRARAEVHLHAARAALDAGRCARAETELRASGRDDPVAMSLGALVALADGRLQDAVERARAVVSQEDADPAAVCEAWEVLGRLRRPRDLPGAQAAFAAAHETATAAGLALWRVRALHELGTVQMFLTGRFDRLQEAHEAATSLGALSTAAVLDIQIGSCLALALEPEAALARARAAAALAERTGARPISAAAAVVSGQAHSYAGRWAEADRAAAQARELSGEDPETRALLAAVVDGIGGLLTEQRERARRGFEQMAELQPLAPQLPPTPALTLRVLLGTVEGAPWAAAAREEVVAAGATTVPYNALLLAHAEAVAQGSAGQGTAAAATLLEADRRLADLGGGPVVHHLAHLGRRLVAEAALRDGWGEPTAWLRAALAAFEQTAPAVADACRRLLRGAGAPAPRPGGATRRPLPVRAAGITEREYDVLLLVACGATNRQVADRLTLSTRTVETHVARLLAKCRCAGRGELSAWARAAGVDVSSGRAQHP